MEFFDDLNAIYPKFKKKVLGLDEEYICAPEEKLRVDMLFKIAYEKLQKWDFADDLKRYFAAELGKHLSTEKIELRAVNYDYAVRYDNIIALKLDFRHGFDFLVIKKKNKIWYLNKELVGEHILDDKEWILSDVDGMIRVHCNDNMRGKEIKRFDFPTIYFEVLKK